MIRKILRTTFLTNFTGLAFKLSHFGHFYDGKRKIKMKDLIREYSEDSNKNSGKASIKIPKIYNNMVEAIGRTPLVRMRNIEKALGLKVQLLAKCEFSNPGGSLKDRIGA